MSKKPSLSIALSQASGSKTHGTERNVPSETTMSEVKAPNGVPPSRKGKKMVAAHFDPAVSYQLKLLALEKDSSVQALLSEAINDLFFKYDRPPIA
jgi:hypothetical protein